VTNAFFTVAPKCIFSEEMKPTLVLHSFQKSLDLNEGTVAVSVKTTHSDWHTIDDDHLYDKKSDHVSVTSSTSETSGLQEQINSLKKINSDLYEFAVGKLLQPFSDIQEQGKKCNGQSSLQPASSKSVLKVKKMKKKSKILRK
jgi:hypothetical protein